MKWRWTLATTAALTAAQFVSPPDRPATAPIMPGDDRTCAVCHPGAVRGLRQSVHGKLWIDETTRGTACSVCHGDLSDHVQAQRHPGQRHPGQGNPAPVSGAPV